MKGYSPCLRQKQKQSQYASNSCFSSCSCSFLCLITSISSGGCSNQIHLNGDIAINCGSAGTSADGNGKEWIGDAPTKFTSSLHTKGLSTSSSVMHKLNSACSIPYKTARISLFQFSYPFHLNPGQKLIRLHFKPTQYKGFKGLKDLFTVEAGQFTLLANFSASMMAHAHLVEAFVKEFFIWTDEKSFNMTFSPANGQSRNTYAFINGIEILSVPMHLSYFDAADLDAKVGDQKSLVYVSKCSALERIHRLKITRISMHSDDNFGDIFSFGATMPNREANKFKKIAWELPVDAGFRYVVRIHLSEHGLKAGGADGMNFSILINGILADTNTDIFSKVEEYNFLGHINYILTVKGDQQERRGNLIFCLLADFDVMDGYGPLKGFEIFKLSNSENSLASPNPLLSASDSLSNSILSVVGQRNALATLMIFGIALVNVFVHKLRELWEAHHMEAENKPSASAERVCRRFSLTAIQLATRNFSDGLVIGRGGFGKVYKGLIDSRPVAVKRLKANSRQGAQEFLMEIETLSDLRHINLVPLIGYCNEEREMILIYEFMAKGTLADHLHKHSTDSDNCCSLTWKQRLNICIGAGRGLDYLHTD